MLTDPMMVFLILFMFSGMVYLQASAVTENVNNASLAIVDEDNSLVSRRIANAFFPPNFQRPDYIEADDVTGAMADGRYLFVLSFPPNFERDLRRGWQPTLYLDVDATAMMQAGLGDGYIQSIVAAEITDFLQSDGASSDSPVALQTRRAFNPNGTQRWFQAISAVLDFLSLVTIILVGAALIREREHGTIEHLLVMPLTATEVALAKIWANGLIILVAFSGSLTLVVEGLLGVPVAGSRGLLMFGAAAFLFAQASIGILLGIVARSMAQFALLMLLVVLPMMMLSGGMSPVESQPNGVRQFTWLFPSRHFLSFSHAIVFRGADLTLVCGDLLRLLGLGSAYLVISLTLFRRSLSASG
ncbi:ABC transporter permease [Pseudoruegeria sp. HB172150]|uniref:ABC transporter permease n=1 Tax=Pseudoruegeria sp. HB172150 TaxID=2721164 RepID=UPI00352C147A